MLIMISKNKITVTHVGKKIKILRIQNNLQQTELAEILGVSQTHMSNIEHDRLLPSVKTLLKLKQHFKINIDELLESEIVNNADENTTIKSENINKEIIQQILALIKRK